MWIKLKKYILKYLLQWFSLKKRTLRIVFAFLQYWGQSNKNFTVYGIFCFCVVFFSWLFDPTVGNKDKKRYFVVLFNDIVQYVSWRSA